MENEEQRIREERGKLKAELKTIKEFLRAQYFTEKVLNYWKTGGEFVECEVCGGLRGSKTWDKIR